LNQERRYTHEALAPRSPPHRPRLEPISVGRSRIARAGVLQKRMRNGAQTVCGSLLLVFVALQPPKAHAAGLRCSDTSVAELELSSLAELRDAYCQMEADAELNSAVRRAAPNGLDDEASAAQVECLTVADRIALVLKVRHKSTPPSCDGRRAVPKPKGR
jgi:hypothetical protein